MQPSMQPSMQQALSEFGLSDPEIAVYLASLEFGSQPAGFLAKKSGFKRGHTYNILESLAKKGLIQEFTKNSIRYFTSRQPQTLLSLLDHRRSQLNTLKEHLARFVPDLELLRNPLLLQPKVRFFQGIPGIQEIYEDTIRDIQHEIYALGDFEYFFPESKNLELNEWIWKYASRRAKKGIWYYGIINKSEKSNFAYKRRREQKRRMKMLHGIYLPVEINIYGNKVAVMSTYRDMVGLIIEDIPIAETLRNFHKAVWKFLPDYRLSK